MSAIFISYRREETAGEARALFEVLSRRIGADAVFMDVEGIGPGVDFREALRAKLESVDTMLVLIGRRWSELRDVDGLRRLDDPVDLVRAEIFTAIERKIAVTPVLLQGAAMPRERELPEEIRPLAFRNAFELRHTRWRSDVSDLLKELRLPAPTSEVSTPLPNLISEPPPDSPPRRAWLIGTGLAAVGVAAVGVSWYRGWLVTSPSPEVARLAERVPSRVDSDVGVERDPKATLTLAVSAQDDHLLVFKAWSSAGAEEWTVPIHPEEIEKVVRSGWVSYPEAQQSTIVRALGVQLLPVVLRRQVEALADDASVRLVVDVNTASWPWEVILGTTTERSRPLRVARGLKGVKVPGKSQRSGRRALIVAAPDLRMSQFPPLPGAIVEGAIVRTIPKNGGFDVQLSSEGTSGDVLRDFFSADRRILLISAYGTSDAKLPSGETVSGVFLGKETYLTADDFDQLPVAPDLVVLNSMHLGDPPRSSGAAGRLKGFLPARLLQKGVRSVIVAGMAVEDDEAVQFSEDLFRALASGTHTVGTAMYSAQLAALKRAPKKFQWGTYHLYGETDYDPSRV